MVEKKQRVVGGVLRQLMQEIGNVVLFFACQLVDVSTRTLNIIDCRGNHRLVTKTQDKIGFWDLFSALARH